MNDERIHAWFFGTIFIVALGMLAAIFYLNDTNETTQREAKDLRLDLESAHWKIARLHEYEFVHDHKLEMHAGDECTWKKETEHCATLIDGRVQGFDCTVEGCRFTECTEGPQ